ncbi:hypothetical protein KIW84_052844 [Lathyrus oleraceus]|uniref:50S ribosomal protein L16, chloroplastic n=1 Tax=Pisum sativum TaxID=3888 RepID=A0A9D5AFD8_PEA|nr:hypothetical protein KIW84_052844 [Pisum sativum]
MGRSSKNIGICFSRTNNQTCKFDGSSLLIRSYVDSKKAIYVETNINGCGKALEPAWITSRQLEAGRREMSRNVRRGGQIWVRIFPDKPVTVRPTETRMGSGKGSPEYWVAVVKPGKILYEMGGVPENIARKAISIAASKMPIRTQFILSK